MLESLTSTILKDFVTDYCLRLFALPSAHSLKMGIICTCITGVCHDEPLNSKFAIDMG